MLPDHALRAYVKVGGDPNDIPAGTQLEVVVHESSTGDVDVLYDETAHMADIFGASEELAEPVVPGLAVEGILGAPFLSEQNAVIDYAAATLFVGDRPRAAARALREGKEGEPWVEIPLELDPIGFLTLEGGLDDDAGLHTVVDSGAPEAILTLQAAERLGRPLDPADQGAATLGGAVDTFVSPAGTVWLGEYGARVGELLVLDLSAINDSLVLAGLPAIDLLVGGDLLDDHAAVVDYPGEALFLIERSSLDETAE